MLRVAFFGSGSPLSTRTLAAIASGHRLVMVVECDAPGSRRAALPGLPVLSRVFGRASDMRRAAAAAGAGYRLARGRSDPGLLRDLGRHRPDIICVAAYRWVLPVDLYGAPRLGAVNLHTSLLPRHRGVLPLAWVYIADDRETGVTVHQMSEVPDAGDIILQSRFPLARGTPLDTLYHQCVERGAGLMAAALDAIENGAAARLPQDERLATRAPMVAPGMRLVDFTAWDVERVWHCLSGLCPRFLEPLADAAGRPVRYERVLRFDRTSHARTPGTLEVSGALARLYCRGGVVHLALPAPR